MGASPCHSEKPLRLLPRCCTCNQVLSSSLPASTTEPERILSHSQSSSSRRPFTTTSSADKTFEQAARTKDDKDESAPNFLAPPSIAKHYDEEPDPSGRSRGMGSKMNTSKWACRFFTTSGKWAVNERHTLGFGGFRDLVDEEPEPQRFDAIEEVQHPPAEHYPPNMAWISENKWNSVPASMSCSNGMVDSGQHVKQQIIPEYDVMLKDIPSAERVLEVDLNGSGWSPTSKKEVDKLLQKLLGA